MPSGPSGIDPHFDYAHEILRNIPGYSDQAKLDRFEAGESADALVRLQVSPIQGAFDRAHLTLKRFTSASSGIFIPGPASSARSIYGARRLTSLPSSSLSRRISIAPLRNSLPRNTCEI